MAIVQAKLSSKNQVTIPASVRKTLGVGAFDRVNFVTEGGKVSVEPVKLTLADIRQAIPALRRNGVPVEEPSLEELMVMDGEAERINALGDA